MQGLFPLPGAMGSNKCLQFITNTNLWSKMGGGEKRDKIYRQNKWNFSNNEHVGTGYDTNKFSALHS